MGEREVTRRQLLAGLAGAGGIGAAVGTGTAAMVTDETIFPNSTFRSGTVDLSVEWASGGTVGTSSGLLSIPVELTGEDPSQRIDLTVSLPERDGENNPASVWLRSRCPEDGELARALDVSIRYVGCQSNCELFSGSLWELASGVPIDEGGDASLPGGEHRCFEPGDDVDLVMDVGIANFEGHGSAEFDLEFVGTQCRHSDRGNPFPQTDDCTPSDDPRHAISYVAVCTSADGPIEPDLSVSRWNDDGQPLKVTWQTDVDVDFVCVKSAMGLTIYDYRDAYRNADNVYAGDPSAAVRSLTLAPGEAADPCEIAVRELGDDSTGPLQSVKIEWENEQWKTEQEDGQ